MLQFLRHKRSLQHLDIYCASVFTLSPALRTNNAENTWQFKQQVVDGNTPLPASVVRLFLTSSPWWCGMRHSFPLLITQTREVKADLKLLSFICFQVDVVGDITRF